MKTKGVLITIGVTVLIVGLFVWGNLAKSGKISFFQNTEVMCLNNGHQNLAFHIHPQLKITVDGVEEGVPSNVGINNVCMSEVHTHDTTGSIHVESVDSGRLSLLNLGHFFDVWGNNSTREGYNLEIYLDGELRGSIEEVELIDKSLIELKYTSL